MDYQVFVISNCNYFHRQIANILTQFNIKITSSLATARDATPALSSPNTNIIIADMFMPDANAIDLIKKFHNHLDDNFFIVISALNSKSVIVNAIKAGAFDFLPLPLHENNLIQSILRARQRIEYNQDFTGRQS